MRILEPISVRDVRIRNRIVMPAMTTRLAAQDGRVTDELIAYYEARARGGVGLIVVELSSPHPSGRHRRRELGVYDDRFVDGLARLVQQLKRHGVKTSIQIGHAGSHARPDVTGFEAVAPSTVPHPVEEGNMRLVRPRPLSVTEIRDLIRAYAETAGRVKLAGFDLVELHGAHDYLIAQFLSPLDNKRDDAYGGGIKGRGRFAIEVVEACREVLGETPIGFRMNGDEFVEGGFSRADAIALAPMLEAAGVDLISVSAGSHRSSKNVICAPMAYPDGHLVPLANAVKQVVGVPVVAVGRLHAPQLANSVVENGSADLVALGRALLADPDWVNKVSESRIDEIRPCIACNTCVDHLRGGEQVRCLVNPVACNEESMTVQGIAKPRRIVVIGGGPAGLTAAIHLQERGHHVTLFEASDTVGGKLLKVPMAPCFENVENSGEHIMKLVGYLARMTRRAGVDMRLETRATTKDVLREEPDAVVAAMGGRYPPGLLAMLSVPGLRRLAGAQLVRDLFLKVRLAKDQSLVSELRRAGARVYEIGDYSGTRGVEDALRSATQVGFELR